MRFELTPDMITAAKQGEPIQAGIDHPAYPVAAFEIDSVIRDSLTADLESSAVH